MEVASLVCLRKGVSMADNASFDNTKLFSSSMLLLSLSITKVESVFVKKGEEFVGGFNYSPLDHPLLGF